MPSRDLDATEFVRVSDVVPGAIEEIRYFTTYNFTGHRVAGYEQPCALLTGPAAMAIARAAEALERRGLRVRVYDAYRPQRAVNDFIAWAQDLDDARMKGVFYPDVEKAELFERDYIAARSSHSRGSTVDLTLFDDRSGANLDMGSPFDFFGDVSHSDFAQLGARQLANRRLLREVMESAGFAGIPSEWWHFTLVDEPFPTTYFDFPVRADAVR